MELLVNILAGIIIAATPLVFAAIGELVVERSGVLNLGVEGMMIVGAIAGFAVTVETGSAMLGALAAILSGMILGFLFAFLTQTLLANQVATGLALTMFGLGLAALVGQSYTGKSLDPIPKLHIPIVSDLPIIGPLLFGHDALVYLTVVLVVAVAWFMSRTRAGLIVRAVGENHDAAHAIGYPVVAIRYTAILFGAACAGLGGAYLSLAQTSLWSENMTAGRGWIALALVVFAAWRPLRALFGAYLFGAISILQLHGQGLGLDIAPQLISMLPYLATIIVLVLISQDQSSARRNAPACLGRTFRASA